jgi:hypothetical protein
MVVFRFDPGRFPMESEINLPIIKKHGIRKHEDLNSPVEPVTFATIAGRREP